MPNIYRFNHHVAKYSSPREEKVSLVQILLIFNNIAAWFFLVLGTLMFAVIISSIPRKISSIKKNCKKI